jgi:hypothetical protein
MIRAKFKSVYHTGTQRAFATLGESVHEAAGIGGACYFLATVAQELIRAAHAKEKQHPEEFVQPPESP